jgi:hypothetical protein
MSRINKERRDKGVGRGQQGEEEKVEGEKDK